MSNENIKVIPARYPEIRPNFKMKGWGAENPQKSNIWMSAQINPLEDKFKEGLKLLDYGCGNGRISNFLSGRLKDYTYYGVEPDGSAGLSIAKEYFSNPKHHFDLIGSEIEKEALENVDCIVLGSIFTHLKIEDFEIVMEKFKNSLLRGCDVVFSMFIGDEYWIRGEGGCYGIENCYALVIYTMDQLENFCKDNNYILKEFDSYLAQEVHLHRMFKVSYKND